MDVNGQYKHLADFDDDWGNYDVNAQKMKLPGKNKAEIERIRNRFNNIFFHEDEEVMARENETPQPEITKSNIEFGGKRIPLETPINPQYPAAIAAEKKEEKVLLAKKSKNENINNKFKKSSTKRMKKHDGEEEKEKPWKGKKRKESGEKGGSCCGSKNIKLMITSNNNNNNNNNNNDDDEVDHQTSNDENLEEEKNNKVERKKELRMDRKFYSQISFQILYNQSFSKEMRDTNFLINNNAMNDIDINAINCEKYLQLNFYHQRCGKTIYWEKPPPIKVNILLKIFGKIIHYFITSDEIKVQDKELHCIRDFLYEFQSRYRHNFSFDNLYKTLLLSYYSYQSYSFHAMTDITFPNPDDPMIDFSKEDIPIHQMSLNKRSKNFIIYNPDKKSKLLQKLVTIVFDDLLMKRDENQNKKEKEILKQMIVADMRNCLNLFDPLVIGYPYLAGLVSILSFLTDVIFVGCGRMSFRKK